MKKRGRPPGFDRQIALDAAMRTFWQYGYAGTAIGDLTIAMAISAQSLYAAFGSKSELYREALDRYQRIYCAAMQSPLSENITCTKAIEKMLRATAAVYCDASHPRGCMIATANLGCAARNCAEVRYVAELRQKATDAIAERIEKGLRRGELAKSVKARVAADYVSALIQGLSVRAQDGATEAQLSAVIDMALSCLFKPGA